MAELTGGNDRGLCDRIIHGVAAFSELQDRFRRRLELHLLGRCQRSDGRSQEKAIEIASQVLSDCFAKSPSLLEKWKGDDNLEAFLRTVAQNRLKSWWDSRDAETEVDSDSRSITEATAGGMLGSVDWEELRSAAAALRAGGEAARQECPEGLVFLRLKGLHGVDQRMLSKIWKHHEAQTSRRIKEAMTLIRETAVKRLAAKGDDIDAGSLQAALQGDPSILLGDDGFAMDDAEMELLRNLVGGNQDRVLCGRAVDLMCRNSRALEHFERLMNRASEGEAVVVKDPALAGMAARLNDCMRRSVEIMKPSEVRDLVTPLISEGFADTLRAIEADGGTLWLLSPGEAVLEAVFNPLEPEISGKRQPLVSGIISLALATSESIRVEDAGQHGKHSAAVDAALGKSTRSMIAVPFRWMDCTRGVLTAVRFGTSAFSTDETGVIERQARMMARLLQLSLQSRVLE